MIVVRIHGWHNPEQWATLTRWHIRSFASRLADYTNMSKPDCEAMAKRVLGERSCQEIPLAKARDRYDATTIRSFLDSLGADTTVDEINALASD